MKPSFKPRQSNQSPGKPIPPQSAKFVELSPYYKHGLDVSKKSFKPRPANTETGSNFISPRQNEIVNLQQQRSRPSKQTPLDLVLIPSMTMTTRDQFVNKDS